MSETREPLVGEPLYYSLPFDAGDVFQAYIAGARSGRAHQPTDHLIERAADAYVKLQYVTRPTPERSPEQ